MKRVAMHDASDDDDAAALRRDCDDARARRELLWLRAMEKGDEESVRDLELVEPGLRQHTQAVVAGCRQRGGAWVTERRDAYGDRFLERFAFHARRLAQARRG
jgi:hypothetical protein